MKERSVLIVTPHPDDETLGVGGTICRHRREGHRIHWLIVTEMKEGPLFSKERRDLRQAEIMTVSRSYGFDSTSQLGFPTAELDTVSLKDLVSSIAKCVERVAATDLYIPYGGDAHSDHDVVSKATLACTKWFRYPSVKRVLAYETLSETEFGIDPTRNRFTPQVYVDISPYLDTKLEIMRNYSSEMGAFPFPRSEEAIRANAMLRGSTIGCQAAEAFMLLKEVWEP